MSTLLGILAVWFLGSIPLAILVGRGLAAKDRAAQVEPGAITVEPESQGRLAS
ncbi:MAG: hypothetical protein ABI700_32095 [Chloroflexota bacterium]